MALESLNPFAGLGKAVKGDRFVGRKKEINLIHQHVLGTEFSNVEIYGLPKSGKSSLAWNALCPFKEELAKKNTFVIYYSINKASNAIQFFKNLALRSHDEIEEYFDEYEPDEKYLKVATPIVSQISESDDIEEVQRLLERYFKKVLRPRKDDGKGGCGYKLIYILDEFDHSNAIFEVGDFQALREHASEAEYKICLITCSRKRLHELEKRGDGNKSNFYQIFTDCPVGTFDEESVKDYWDRISSYFNNIQQQKMIVEYLTGNHPWLMDIVNNYYYLNKDESISVDKNIEGVELQLMEALDSMAHTIEHEGLLNDAIQLVTGPYFNVLEDAKTKLEKYHFIKKVPSDYKKKLFGGQNLGPTFKDESYICFSAHCTLDLYRRYYANVPYFALWSETENALRDIIIKYLDQYSEENWIDEMAAHLDTCKPFQGFKSETWKKGDNGQGGVQALLNNRKNMVNRFPSMKNDHIVSFTLTSQIFNLFIKVDWGWFGNIFKGGKQNWDNKFNHLINVRDPIAHNNPGEFESEKELAKRYCKEILESIKTWKAATT